MSARLCYLKREDRGDVLAGVRLIGQYTDDSWRAPQNTAGEFDAVEHVRLATHAAGEWIAHAVRSSKGAKLIDMVCLDIEGSSCAWVTAPSEQPTVVSAAYSHLGDEDSSVALAPAELSTIETMSSISAGTGEERRIGLIASPDSVARLVLDELDQRGIAISRVCSLWQVIAQAWDPSGRGSDLVHTRLREDRVVATEQPTSAIVIIDPAGKLIWVWSRSGEPVAGGSMRVRCSEVGCAIAPWDVSRLTNDWIAWSAQTGIAPGRVLVVATNTDEAASDEALSPAALGKAISQSWQNATVDMIVEDDPLGETLIRALAVADASTDTSVSLTSLTRRPGRAHRSAHRWVALALLACAGTLTTHAFNQYKRAGAVTTQIAPLVESQRAILAASSAHQDKASQPIGLVPAQLRDELTQKNATRATVRESDRPKPILSELLNIALQLESYQIDGISPKLIDLNPLACRVEIWVPLPTVAYDFLESLKDASEAIEWDDTPQENGRAKGLLLPWSISGKFQSPSSR